LKNRPADFLGKKFRVYGDRIQLSIEGSGGAGYRPSKKKLKLINTEDFVQNKRAFIPQKMIMTKLGRNMSKTKLKSPPKPSSLQETDEDRLKEAIRRGQISHRDLEGIIRRFQAYEHSTIQKNELGIPPDTELQIKARNVLTDRRSLEFSKMRASPSHAKLKNNDSIVLTDAMRSRRNLTTIIT